MFSAWLRQRWNGNPRPRSRAGTSPRPACVLRLEPLEDRWLLSAAPTSTLFLVPSPAQGFYSPGVLFDLAAQGSTVLLTARVPVYSLQVSITSALAQPVSFHAVVNWGDGLQSAAGLVATNVATLNIVGAHTYDTPKVAPAANPAGSSAPAGNDAPVSIVSGPVITSARITAGIAVTGGNSLHVSLQISLQAVEAKRLGDGPVQIDFQFHLVIELAGDLENSGDLEAVSLVHATGFPSGSDEHLPPVPPIPPVYVGPPWKPSPPESIPGFGAPASSRKPTSDPAAVNNGNRPAVVDIPETVRDTNLTTPPAADATTDPTGEWLKGRSVNALLQRGPDMALTINELDRAFEEIVPVPVGPAAPLPRWLVDDLAPGRAANQKEPAAEHLVPADRPRVDLDVARFPPEPAEQAPPLTAAALVAPAAYFGQLDPVEETKQEAVFVTPRAEPASAPSFFGRPYRLLLIVGFSLWSFCRFRPGQSADRARPRRR